MADKTPLRLVLDGNSDPSGLAEFQTGDTLPLSVGGLGASLSLGSAGQVLKVNDGGTAVEFGAVASNMSIAGDTGSDTITIGSDTFTISGGTGLTSTATTDTITLNIDSTVATLTGSQTLTNKTISGASNTLSNIGNASLSNSTITVAGDTGSNAVDLGDTLTIQGTANEVETSVSGDTITIGLPNNVTITGNLTVNGTTTTINSTTVDIQNAFRFEGATADGFETTLTTVDPTADRSISLPDASGTIVLKDTTDTLTNKTLTSPVISTISNTGTLTLPTSTDTLVGRATTDTLTNKTINSASNTITITESNISDLGSYITASSTDTLTNKTISGANNTISGLDAASIGDGSVSNTEFQYLNGVTSSIQTQLNAAASTGKAIAMSIVFG